MMIKNKIMAAVLSAAVLSASSAFAIEIEPKFYVGGEVVGTKLKAKDKNVNDVLHNRVEGFKAKHNPVGPAFFVGSRLNENLGLELGYGFVGKNTITDKTSNTSDKVKHRNVTADVLGYLPVNESTDLIGSVGLGRLSSKFAGTQMTFENGKNRTSKVTPRLGLGAQYKFDENIGVRAMARFQRGNDFVKSATSLGVGAFYQF